MNLGAISSQKGLVVDAIAYYELCVQLMPPKSKKLVKCYELLGFECMKADVIEMALGWFHQATQLSRKVFGRNSDNFVDQILNEARAF